MVKDELFEKLEDVILNKGISIQVMLRAMISMHNKADLMLEYMFKSLDCTEKIVDTFKEVQKKYYEDTNG
jgi:hypothetical protein